MIINKKISIIWFIIYLVIGVYGFVEILYLEKMWLRGYMLGGWCLIGIIGFVIKTNKQYKKNKCL